MAEPVNVANLELVAGLIEHSLTETHRMTDSVIDNLMRQIREAQAWRMAVESGVAALLDGPYAPSAAAIERAVFLPPKALRGHYLAEMEAERDV